MIVLRSFSCSYLVGIERDARSRRLVSRVRVRLVFLCQLYHPKSDAY